MHRNREQQSGLRREEEHHLEESGQEEWWLCIMYSVLSQGTILVFINRGTDEGSAHGIQTR